MAARIGGGFCVDHTDPANAKFVEEIKTRRKNNKIVLGVLFSSAVVAGIALASIAANKDDAKTSTPCTTSLVCKP